MNAIKCTLFAVAMFATTVYADPVMVPNTFTAGTPAKASDVNANFNALANAVTAITPPTVYDIAGKVVGQLADTGAYVYLKPQGYGYVLAGVTKDGFQNGWTPPTRYYESTDCTGVFYWPFNTELIDLIYPVSLDPSGIMQGSALAFGETPVDINSMVIRSSSRLFAGCEQTSNGQVLNSISPNHLLAVPKTIDLSGWVPPFSVH